MTRHDAGSAGRGLGAPLRGPSRGALLSLTLALAASQSGCVLSSLEVVNTERVYLLGPKTTSETGPAVRDVVVKAVDTRGTLAFHLDQARECTVTSVPQFQKVHIEGKRAKDVPGAIVTGSLVTAAGAGMLVASFIVEDGQWMKPKFAGSSEQEFTSAGTLGLTGILFGAIGLILLPRTIYHAAVAGTEVTGGEVQTGKPPPGAVRAPSDYDPKNPKTGRLAPWDAPLGPVAEQPRHAVFALGEPPRGGLLRARPFESGGLAQKPLSVDPTLLAIPSAGGGTSQEMRACVAKYSPGCEAKCSGDRACVLSCLRKPCVEELDEEIAKGGLEQDEYTTEITRTEVCERTAESGTTLVLLVRDADGVQKTMPLGKTNRSGDVQADVLSALETAYPGWPASKQVILGEAQIVPGDEPSRELGTLDLAKYPALKYKEHEQTTRKAREALAAAEAAKRQAELEAAQKAADDAAHAEERKAEAAKKAAACMQQAQSRCSSDCQGNPACVKKCMQKVSCR